MPKIIVEKEGFYRLSGNSSKRSHLPPGTECWLEQKDNSLILLPLLSDIRKLYIEPTTDCNLNCLTCVRNVWDDTKASMDIEVYNELMKQTEELPLLKSIVFGGIGEPLIHPKILKMIQLARNRNLEITVSTNGTHLDKALSAELIKLGVKKLIISLDGVKPDTYSGVRGALLSQVLENINALNETKQNLDSLLPAVEIEFVALKRNIEELKALCELASEYAVSRVLVTNVLAHTEEMKDEILYGYEPRPPFQVRSWPVKLDTWVLLGTPDLPKMHWGAEQRCQFIQDKALVIGWDGNVIPCYALSHNYSYYTVDGRLKHVSRYTHGHILQNSLLEIWTSEEYVRFRNEVQTFNFPSCPDCDLRETCDLREQNEACWGWNPSCADCLYAQDIVRCPGGGR
ncbi:MAG: tungsten cofactor oxidoreductase radical SAM maturase [Spirochaetota bacterium]|nr:MAG: tungsten cofactor oxidoreductase radical SAM maturase [Spirochaetota bacterium]